MNHNNVCIKVTGNESRVSKVLDKIEKVFPLSIRSKTYANREDDGVHGWVTVLFAEAPT